MKPSQHSKPTELLELSLYLKGLELKFIVGRQEKQQVLCNYPLSTLNTQTYKKGGVLTEYINTVVTSAFAHTKYTSSHQTLLPLLPVTSSELRITSSKVSRRSLC